MRSRSPTSLRRRAPRLATGRAARRRRSRGSRIALSELRAEAVGPFRCEGPPAALAANPGERWQWSWQRTHRSACDRNIKVRHREIILSYHPELDKNMRAPSDEMAAPARMIARARDLTERYGRSQWPTSVCAFAWPLAEPPVRTAPWRALREPATEVDASTWPATLPAPCNEPYVSV